MRVLRLEKSKGGKMFRMVDDANPHYDHHDKVIGSQKCVWSACVATLQSGMTHDWKGCKFFHAIYGGGSKGQVSIEANQECDKSTLG